MNNWYKQTFSNSGNKYTQRKAKFISGELFVCKFHEWTNQHWFRPHPQTIPNDRRPLPMGFIFCFLPFRNLQCAQRWPFNQLKRKTLFGNHFIVDFPRVCRTMLLYTLFRERHKQKLCKIHKIYWTLAWISWNRQNIDIQSFWLYQ